MQTLAHFASNTSACRASTDISNGPILNWGSSNIVMERVWLHYEGIEKKNHFFPIVVGYSFFPFPAPLEMGFIPLLEWTWCPFVPCFKMVEHLGTMMEGSTGIRGRGWLELEPGQPIVQLLDLLPSVFEVKATLGRIVIFQWHWSNFNG